MPSQVVLPRDKGGSLCVGISTTITNRRPIPVSALREDNFIDYPYWATRELVMNAVCHRDYTGNGPVQFYQYDDRIEILNPGGLYGKATPENFPRVNDYRNPVIAEGMRVLGYVNRYSWGVSEVRDKLEENGNGLPEFDLDLVTAFLVKEKISPRGMEARRYAIEQGYLVEENHRKWRKMNQKTPLTYAPGSSLKENATPR